MDSDSDDHSLMLAVRDGEIQRLGDLFERHHGPLYGFFVRMTRQRTSSEDLVQQVFYRMLKYRHTYRTDGKFLTWMYHLARKVAADYFRKQSATANSSVDGYEIDRIPSQEDATEDRIERDDDLRVMRAAFAELPTEQREILLLHRFQRVAHEEIAKILDCSVAATRVRLHRAVKSLREIYRRLS